jgi:hypothetical protein
MEAARVPRSSYLPVRHPSDASRLGSSPEDARGEHACVRTPKPVVTETIYPAATISVDTSKGDFVLPISADAQFRICREAMV